MMLRLRCAQPVSCTYHEHKQNAGITSLLHKVLQLVLLCDKVWCVTKLPYSRIVPEKAVARCVLVTPETGTMYMTPV